ncbi:hypothetical protein Ssi03_62150 [Sphaerisporangium siamense]|uniref:Uncharacterized protein n=1 Tax=Sphaerisporangium siamense TaxID=795645 RepID=A0A7W7D9J1_9ACTN|nr:hypothetical protein [Sphaerisporangium siamense]GII88225.1 hypothetical protein Ssi03_62150 [Sphaerisporangium siamense]
MTSIFRLATRVEPCSVRGDARPAPTPPGARAGAGPAALAGTPPVRTHLALPGGGARWALHVQALGGEAGAWTQTGPVAPRGTRRAHGGQP